VCYEKVKLIKKVSMKRHFLYILIYVFAVSTFLFSQSSEYKIAGKIDIGGESRWDYTAIDLPMNRLYVSHLNKVNVIDLKTNTIIGEISGLHGVHGIAFADKFGKGFISNGMNDTVTVFDLKSLKILNYIHVTGKGPDAIVYDPFSQRVFTLNEQSANATVISAKTDEVLGTITLVGTPEFSVSNNKGLLYVNIESKNLIEVINTKTLKTINKIPITPGESPAGLAIDLKNNILFSGCHNKLMVIVNVKTGKIITTLPIGGRVDACCFDPLTNLAFSSNGEGTLTVIKEISPKEFKVIDNVTTQKGLRTMALDPVTHNIYLIGMLEGQNNSKSFGVLILEKK
jgi:hypothetical protein